MGELSGLGYRRYIGLHECEDPGGSSTAIPCRRQVQERSQRGITGASLKSKMSFKLGHGDGEVEKVFGMTALTRVRKTSKEFEG